MITVSTEINNYQLTATVDEIIKTIEYNSRVNTYEVTSNLLQIGIQGEAGADGVDGADGADGAQGIQGEAGADGVAPVMQVNNTDTSTDINSSTANFTLTIPVSGTVENGSDSVLFTKTANGITCNFNGFVLANSNIHIQVAGARVAVQSRLRKNGVLFGSVGASGYIRNANGHTESSIHSSGFIKVSEGDEITVGAKRESTVTTNTSLFLVGTSNLIVMKVN